MVNFLNVYTLDPQAGLKKTAVLQNAFGITETQELNKIYMLDFSIPSTDEKTKYILPFHYVRYGDKGQLYRIIKINFEDSDKSILNVSCEHVIAVLCDELMFGMVKDGGAGIRTADVIDNLLQKQTVRNWKLVSCGFDRKFEYLWEQENILNALYSIPKEFTKAYKWTFDTTKYPWELSLEEIDASIPPEYYIRAKRNLLSSGTNQDFAGICTRIYPLGYGEGINQLTIKDALVDRNTGEVDTDKGEKWGQTFIESPAEITALYGIKEKVLVDRRFENAESLYTYGKTMLEGLQTPSMSRSFDVVDLYPLTSQNIDNAEVGKICRMTGDGTTAYITKTVRVLDDPGNLQIELSTKATDVASTIADLADRVRIESVYAQGATQLYQHSKDANATTTKGMIMSLYFPSEMRQINKVLMRLKLGKFRSYSQTSEYGGKIDEDTGKAGDININTGDGGAINKNTGDGGGFSKNTGDGGAINKNTGDGGAFSKNTGKSGGFSKNTGDGGAINTQSQPGGGGSGQTGVASGGGGISLTPTVSVEIGTTDDADWKQTGDLYVQNSDEIDVHMDNAGAHTHNIAGGYSNYTQPLESQSYNHVHWFSDENAYTNEKGGHTHDNAYADIHGHDIRKYTLRHVHAVNANVEVKVNNISGYSGFEHSHSFTIGDHQHGISVGDHQHSISVSDHQHLISVGDHKHPITVGDHKHSITVGDHKHPIKVDGHTHKIDVPAHKHDITPGIFESGNPSSFDIYVSGNKKATVNKTNFDGDITEWLLNEQNQIPRDSWINIEIRPNDLAYVQSSIFIQGFVQSRGGGNY